MCNVKMCEGVKFYPTENAESLSVDISEMGVLVPTKVNKKMLEAVKHIPSIMGDDFLEDYNFALHFDPSARMGYLERASYRETPEESSTAGEVSKK